MANKIVVTGATGNIGSRVVKDLLAKGKEVVAFARNPEKAAALKAAGASIAKGTFEDAASLRAAFTGADVVVLITEANKEAQIQAENALAAARETGVRKIVRVSAIRASQAITHDGLKQHANTEGSIIRSGFTYVILRPTMFLDTVLWSLESILKEGKIYFGMGESRIAAIDSRDISDCVTVAAASDKFDNQILELSGPAIVDFHQVAAALSKGLGREVQYVAPSLQTVADSMRAMQMSDWMSATACNYYTIYMEGWSEFTTDNVQRITGHPARSVDDFVKEVVVPIASAAAK